MDGDMEMPAPDVSFWGAPPQPRAGSAFFVQLLLTRRCGLPQAWW